MNLTLAAFRILHRISLQITDIQRLWDIQENAERLARSQGKKQIGKAQMEGAVYAADSRFLEELHT